LDPIGSQWRHLDFWSRERILSNLFGEAVADSRVFGAALDMVDDETCQKNSHLVKTWRALPGLHWAFRPGEIL
jgi:hypothetical protein